MGVAILGPRIVVVGEGRNAGDASNVGIWIGTIR
jgi:hypothetical protein